MCFEACELDTAPVKVPVPVDPRHPRFRPAHHQDGPSGSTTAGLLSKGRFNVTPLPRQRTSYFGSEWLVLLTLLAVSLVTLPLVLPPLPPPPPALLLLPVAILALLMILAFMPRHARDFSHGCM